MSLVLWLIGALPVFQGSALLADSPNLVLNGRFEELGEKEPVAWYLSSSSPEIFQFSFPQEKERGHAAQIEAKSAEKSSYLSQVIHLQPQTDYRLSALIKLDQGRLLVRVYEEGEQAKLDLRIYVKSLKAHPLAPFFWEKGWIQGKRNAPPDSPKLVKTFWADPDEWEPVFLDFNSGESTEVIISLGAYFEVGSYLFDEISVREISKTKP